MALHPALHPTLQNATLHRHAFIIPWLSPPTPTRPAPVSTAGCEKLHLQKYGKGPGCHPRHRLRSI